MVKSATALQPTRSGGKSLAGSDKATAIKRTKTGSFVVKGTRIDPRVAQALAVDSPPSRFMTVMVKLNPRASKYARFSVSNASGNERGRVFQAEVEEIVQRTAAQTGKVVEVLSRMPNVGVAKVKAPTSALRTLVQDDKIVGVQLAGS